MSPLYNMWILVLTHVKVTPLYNMWILVLTHVNVTSLHKVHPADPEVSLQLREQAKATSSGSWWSATRGCFRHHRHHGAADCAFPALDNGATCDPADENCSQSSSPSMRDYQDETSNNSSETLTDLCFNMSAWRKRHSLSLSLFLSLPLSLPLSLS